MCALPDPGPLPATWQWVLSFVCVAAVLVVPAVLYVLVAEYRLRKWRDSPLPRSSASSSLEPCEPFEPGDDTARRQ